MAKIKVSIAQDKIYIPHIGACTPIFNYDLPEKVVADLLAQGVQVTAPDGTPMIYDHATNKPKKGTKKGFKHGASPAAAAPISSTTSAGSSSFRSAAPRSTVSRAAASSASTTQSSPAPSVTTSTETSSSTDVSSLPRL